MDLFAYILLAVMDEAVIKGGLHASDKAKGARIRIEQKEPHAIWTYMLGLPAMGKRPKFSQTARNAPVG